MSSRTFVIQRRIGKGKWKTISKGLPEPVALSKLDELLANRTDVRHQYRLIGEHWV